MCIRDSIYISNKLSSKLKSCVIERSQRENIQPSDHVPVMINLEIDNSDEDYFEDEENFFEIWLQKGIKLKNPWKCPLLKKFGQSFISLAFFFKINYLHSKISQ